MIEKIDKRLLNYENRKNSKLTEQEEWAAAGCSNNNEWHEHLNKLLWKPYNYFNDK